MPFTFETDRLILREWVAGDAEFLFRLNNDPEVIRFTGDTPFKNVGAARKLIDSYDQYTAFGYGRWLCLEKEGGQAVGWCGLKNQGFIDLGYRFLRSAWGKGYATESAFGSLEKGFEHFNLTEVIGRVAEGNESSEKVVIKLGMKFTHIDHCHGLPTKHFSLTAEKWPEVKQVFLDLKVRSRSINR